MPPERVRRGGRHRRAHVVHVLNRQIDNAPQGDVCRAANRAAHRCVQQRSARARDRPLRRGRPLIAVFQRVAVLPLRRGIMAACCA